MSLLLHPTNGLMNCLNIRSSQPVPVKAIESVTGRSASIKWVNDIYMDGKKSGILSEAVSDMESGRISHIIIGIGLNFLFLKIIFQLISRKAISVFSDGQASVTRNQLISKIWQELFTYLSHPEKRWTSIKKNSYWEKRVVQSKGTTYVGLAKSVIMAN